MPFGTGLGRRLAANTVHVASGRLAALAVWVVFTPAILRALGPEGFGIWALFYALTGYLFALDFGLAQGTIRAVAAARERGDYAEAGAFASLALWGYLGLGILWFALALVGGDAVVGWLRIPMALAPAARFATVAGAAIFAIVGAANLGIAIMQGYGRFELGNLTLLGMTVAQAVGMGIALARHAGLSGLVFAVGISGAFGCALCWVLLGRLTPRFQWAGRRSMVRHVRQALRFGGPVQLTNTFAAVHVHVDKLFLSRFVALATVTSFELGSRVAIAVAGLPQLLLLSVMPETAALHVAGQNERLRELYDRASRYYLTMVAVVMAPVLAAGGRIYFVWLGAAHPEAELALRWLAVSAAVSLLSGLATTMARGVARPDLEAWLAAAAVVLHVVFSAVLVPRVGLPGALIAIAVTNIAAMIGFLVAFGRLMRWPLFAGVLKPLVIPILATTSGALAGAALDRWLPAGTGLWAWLGLGAVAAIACLTALGVVLVTGFLRWREARTLLLSAHGLLPTTRAS